MPLASLLYYFKHSSSNTAEMFWIWWDSFRLLSFLNILGSSGKAGMAELASGSHGNHEPLTSNASLKLDIEFQEEKDQQHFQIYT